MPDKNKNNQQNKAKGSRTQNVPVAGDLAVSTDCVKKSVGANKEE